MHNNPFIVHQFFCPIFRVALAQCERSKQESIRLTHENNSPAAVPDFTG
jgi:hypothetical protein